MKKKVLMIVLPSLQSPEEAKRNVPSTRMRSVVSLPYGVLSVMSYNKDLADFRLIDCNVSDLYMNDIVVQMHMFRPDIVGLAMTLDVSYKYLETILETIRSIDPEVITVIGGAATFPSQVYETILNEQYNIDAVCFYEGELPFRRLLESTYPYTYMNDSPAWITRWSLRAEMLPQKSLKCNLDDVVELDYSFVDINNYPAQEESLLVEKTGNEKLFYVSTSRGCPFKCSFCTYSLMDDRKMRYASISKVIDCVRNLVGNHGMTVLSLCDDQLLVNMPRAKEIFRQLEQFHIRVEVLQGCSVGFIDEEMAILMKAAGVLRVTLPMESGSREVLDMMVEKPVDLDKAKDTIKMLRKYGFWITALFVIGMPGETDEHRKETSRWIEEAGLDWCTFGGAIPLWGTKLYNMCVEKGYITEEIKIGALDFSNYFINVPGYPPEHVTKQIYHMNLWHNFVNNYQMRQGDYHTAARVFRNVISSYPTQAFAYYYLAECYEKMGYSELRNLTIGKFNEIVRDDPKWAEYARELGIGG